MRTEAERWTAALFHGWLELLTLFGMLLAALLLIGLCWNRGLRPSDRPALISWSLLLASYALAVAVHRFEDALPAAIVIAAGVMLAGLIARVSGQRGLWIPVTLLASLLGLGYNLSFVLLTVLIMLVLLLSAGRDR